MNKKIEEILENIKAYEDFFPEKDERVMRIAAMYRYLTEKERIEVGKTLLKERVPTIKE